MQILQRTCKLLRIFEIGKSLKLLYLKDFQQTNCIFLVLEASLIELQKDNSIVLQMAEIELILDF